MKKKEREGDEGIVEWNETDYFEGEE